MQSSFNIQIIKYKEKWAFRVTDKKSAPDFKKTNPYKSNRKPSYNYFYQSM